MQVWCDWQVTLCDPSSTPERIRGEVLTTMRYTNRRLPLPLPYNLQLYKAASFPILFYSKFLNCLKSRACQRSGSGENFCSPLTPFYNFVQPLTITFSKRYTSFCNPRSHSRDLRHPLHRIFSRPAPACSVFGIAPLRSK